MVTLAPTAIKQVVPAWEDEYPSAAFSGIVDELGLCTGGYHLSIEDQINPHNFSVILTSDKVPPGDWPVNLASALDMSMDMNDLVLSTRRWMAVWADPTDFRRRFFRAFDGWTGSGNAKRWDFVKGTARESGNRHQWHQHVEWRRRWANSLLARDAAISILRGQHRDDWMANQPDSVYLSRGR